MSLSALTRAPERDESPSWSPDGQRIAFVRRIPDRVFEVFVMPALGGAERRVASFVLDSSRRSTRLSWSPDGKWVAIGGKPSDSEPFGLWLVEIDGAEKRRLRPRQVRTGSRTSGPVLARRAPHRLHPNQGDQGRHLHPSRVASYDTRRQPFQAVSDPRRRPSKVSRGLRTAGASCFQGAELAPTRLNGSTYRQLEARRPSATPALRRTCHSDQHRGHRTHGVPVLLRDANFWKVDVTRPGGVPLDAGLPVHVRRDNAIVTSGWQAGRAHLHTLRFRGALHLRCRRHDLRQ